MITDRLLRRLTMQADGRAFVGCILGINDAKQVLKALRKAELAVELFDALKYVAPTLTPGTPVALAVNAAIIAGRKGGLR